MQVFVFEPDAAVLYVLDGEAEALRFAADNSVALLFFAADGSPLQHSRMLGGDAYLRPWAACGSCRLEQVLHAVREVRRAGQVVTLDAVVPEIEEGTDE